jgi:DNA-binding HxlR family transcriptional regulator
MAVQRTNFGSLQCPIARSLERVGEWWSILILRDAFQGISRFDDFQKSLNIAPNMLTRRLRALVDHGLLERRRYSDKPARYEYVPTQCGHDFRPVLLTLMTWGNRHFAPEGISMFLADERTGQQVEPVLIDARTGERIDREHHSLRAGPAASERLRSRVEFSRRQRSQGRAQFPS